MITAYMVEANYNLTEAVQRFHADSEWSRANTKKTGGSVAGLSSRH